jgi:ribosome-associated translation inhibitor RaiA
MTATQHASILFQAWQSDKTLLDQYRRAFQGLATSVYVQGTGKTITSASKNGATYTAIDQIPPHLRARVLQLAIKYCEANTTPTSKTFSAF